MRRPAPATIIATVALVLAVTPVGEAADGWVKRAIYARNAGTVDGFSASKSPKKGKLVVLPKSGKLPASILPASAGAASGAPGSAGAPGDGSSAVFVGTAAAAVNVGPTQTSVVTLALKAGSYAIVAKASLHATLDTSTPGVNCQLKAAGDGDQIDSDLSSSSDDPVALITTHTFPGPGTVTFTCAADDDGVVASDARVVALRVSS